ncbi:hypothetical protein K1719_045451 [Acacia pycnantha]|nr:hypothetical protein K1719_045451 [Acacia pycnantha]
MTEYWRAAKEKEEKETARALEQIEVKAQLSEIFYQTIYRGFEPQLPDFTEWVFDSGSGYYYHQTNGFCYDPKSGFYYSDAIGKWVTQEEAYASPHFSSDAGHKGPTVKKPTSASQSNQLKIKVQTSLKVDLHLDQ